MLSPGRAAAFEILRKVERGGYASDLLRQHTAEMAERDAALAGTLVFGVLRFRAQLDFLIGHYAGRARKLDAEVRIALWLGIYQLRYLERVPPHAGVAESVELVKRARKTSAAGFVNAVLRKVDRAPVAWPSREIALSCPEWLLERWQRQYGAETAAGVARAALARPGTYRSETGRMQDIGSQTVVPLLGLEAGQSFLDVCAAPGNKTAQALAAGVQAIACDLHYHRLAQLKSLGVPLVVLDGAHSLPFRRRFDRILLDAPCSGTGTLARNPEIKWKLRKEDLADLAARQRALLASALAALEPAGTLVYATCSLEAEENENIVAQVPGGRVTETMHRIPGRDAGDGFYAAVIKSIEAANG